MSIEIRKMTIGDVEAVKKIGDKTPQLSIAPDDLEFWGIDRLTSWVKEGEDKDVMLVASEKSKESKVLGFILTQLHLHSRMGYISDIALVPEARGKGLGAKLTEQALRQMKDIGIDYVYALTLPKNMPIQELLIKEGFEKCELMTWFDKSI